jgi:hypothetical protein
MTPLLIAARPNWSAAPTKNMVPIPLSHPGAGDRLPKSRR